MCGVVVAILCEVRTHIRGQPGTRAWGSSGIHMGELRQQPRAPGQLEGIRTGPCPLPSPSSQGPRHIPSETVDLLHVEATGGTVS